MYCFEDVWWPNKVALAIDEQVSSRVSKRKSFLFSSESFGIKFPKDLRYNIHVTGAWVFWVFIFINTRMVLMIISEKCLMKISRTTRFHFADVCNIRYGWTDVDY